MAKTWLEKKSYTRRLKTGKKIVVKAHKQRYRKKRKKIKAVVKKKEIKKGKSKIKEEKPKENSYIDEMEDLMSPFDED
jgi:hypothetical protein